MHLMDIDHMYEFYAGNSRLAVEEYNRRFKDLHGELEFVKVLKAVGYAAAGFVLYLTFEAKSLAAAADDDDGGCKIKIYQSEVFDGIGKTTVESFRLKPPEDEQEGSGKQGGAWFWNDNTNGKSEYLIYKLKEMGKVSDKDIMQICKKFDRPDTGNCGKITLADLMGSHH